MKLTAVTSRSMTVRSGVTTRSWKVPAMARSPAAELLGLLDGFLDRADHVERGLGQRVVLAFQDLLEAAHRVLALHELARRAGELLGDEERLRQEPLDAARARDRLLVVV